MENKKADKNALVLAALLHDIGKFQWRANDIIAGKNHETYSQEIFGESISHKACISYIKDEINNLILHHGNHILSSIKKADQLDAASNRQDEKNPQSRRPLISVASRVELKHPAPSDFIYYYKPAELSIENIFPDRLKGILRERWSFDSDELQRLHAELFVEFTNELKLLPENNVEALTDTLLFLFEKYLCRVTSAAYHSVPDISLYDHSKSVAALAVCYEYSDGPQKFLLIGADVSGIQNFIYSDETLEGQTSGGKSKRLRGRSFYLSLLTDTFAVYLARVFGVGRANILINGGGHFIIIVPNSKVNRELYEAEKHKIQKWFLSSFGGTLNLILTHLEADSDLYKNFSVWYDRLSSELIREKRQKGLDFIGDMFNKETVNFDSYDYRLFSVKLQNTMENPEEDDFNKFKKNRYDSYVFMQGKLFERIGEDLPKTQYLLEIHSTCREDFKFEESREHILIKFELFGVYYALLENEEEYKVFLKVNGKANLLGIRIYKLNDTSFMPQNNSFYKGIKYPVSFGFRIMGTEAPRSGKDRKVCEFREIALMCNAPVFNQKNNSEKIPLEQTDGQTRKLDYGLLGILRMDVDNLGTIFSQGLKASSEEERRGESIESLARIVNLSREMNLFFQGYINFLARKWGIYITYSGGDDLFVVGSWINCLHFALELRNDFERFVCGNKNITLSGGLFICKDNYPIGRSAEIAGELEASAKNSSEDKNRLALFNREIGWGELQKLINYAIELDYIVERGEVSSAYVHFLLTQIEGVFKTDTNDKLGNRVKDIDEYYRKLALIRYSLARSPRNINWQKLNEANNGPRVDKYSLFAKLINDEGHEELFDNFIIPASYVILKNRNSKLKGESK